MQFDLKHLQSFLKQRRSILGLSIAVGFTILHLSPLKRTFDRQISRPVEFRLRHWLGKDPKLDPRVRIYALGDSSLEYLQTTELGLKNWADFLNYLADRGASTIFIDKIFGMPRGLSYAEKFVDQVTALEIPIVVGSFISPSPIHKRPMLSLTESKLPRWAPPPNGFAYGPHEKVRGAFRFGHIVYNADFEYELVKRVGPAKGLVLAPLLTIDNLEVSEESIRIGDKTIPHDGSGRILINSNHPDTYAAKTYSIGSVIRAIRNEKKGKPFPEGTKVVVIPDLATGNTDMVSSPLGLMSGGYLTAAVINSALTNQWITPIPAQSLLILFFSLLGLWVGGRLKGTRFWLVYIGGIVSIFCLGNILFAYLQIESPWLLSAVGYAAVSISIFAARMRQVEKNLRLTKDFLDGLVPHERLQSLIKNSSINLEPTERIVTVMFIDVVGFSMAAEKSSPKQAFSYLRSTIGQIIEVVHRHGGIVDKVLGDGAMCFFGYYYDGKESNQAHADAAIRCATEMQIRAIESAELAAKNGDPIFPIRIGVNTAAAQIGNLGTGKKIELTLIGPGVNVCKRLEAAADPFGILIGASTKDLLFNQNELEAKFFPRHVPVKHYRNPLIAFECRSTRLSESRKHKVLDAFRNQVSAERYESRWPVPADFTIEIETSFGKGTLVDFSLSGLGVNLEHFHARGVALELEFKAPELREQIDKLSLCPIKTSVCWATSPKGTFFRTGLKIENVNERQKEKLLEVLTAWVRNQRMKNSA